MSKAFWEGFWTGWFKVLKYSLVFILGASFAYAYLHPYERCKRMYDNQNDISECVWILEND